MERSRAGVKRGWVRADGGIQLVYMCVRGLYMIDSLFE